MGQFKRRELLPLLTIITKVEPPKKGTHERLSKREFEAVWVSISVSYGSVSVSEWVLFSETWPYPLYKRDLYFVIFHLLFSHSSIYLNLFNFFQWSNFYFHAFKDYIYIHNYIISGLRTMYLNDYLLKSQICNSRRIAFLLSKSY